MKFWSSWNARVFKRHDLKCEKNSAYAEHTLEFLIEIILKNLHKTVIA